MNWILWKNDLFFFLYYDLILKNLLNHWDCLRLIVCYDTEKKRRRRKRYANLEEKKLMLSLEIFFYRFPFIQISSCFAVYYELKHARQGSKFHDEETETRSKCRERKKKLSLWASPSSELKIWPIKDPHKAECKGQRIVAWQIRDGTGPSTFPICFLLNTKYLCNLFFSSSALLFFFISLKDLSDCPFVRLNLKYFPFISCYNLLYKRN